MAWDTLYTTGTIEIEAGATEVVGDGTFWGPFADQAAMLVVPGVAPVIVESIDDDTHLTIAEWQGDALPAGTEYQLAIFPRSSLQATKQLISFLEQTKTQGIPYVVPDGEDPNDAIGEDGTVAFRFRPAPFLWWLKVAGHYELQGSPVGTQWRGTWDAGEQYEANDIVYDAGGSWVSKTSNTNKRPAANPDDWDPGSRAGAGGGISIAYTFSTITTDSDPGAGRLRLGSATQNTSTVIRADLIDANGVDVTALLATLDASSSTVKANVRLMVVGEPQSFIDFNLTARANPTGYRNLTVAVTASSGANPFEDGDSILMLVTRTGDKGDTGAQGATGTSGGQGAPGATGAAGADGKTIRYGVGAPSNLLGSDGDFYIAVDTKTLYGPKASGTWPSGTLMKGEQGNEGDQGEGIQPDATGTLAQRDAFDNEPQGFVYLRTDIAPFQLFVKASNGTADWAGPTPIGGTAPVGDLGPITDSVTQIFDYGAIA